MKQIIVIFSFCFLAQIANSQSISLRSLDLRIKEIVQSNIKYENSISNDLLLKNINTLQQKLDSTVATLSPISSNGGTKSTNSVYNSWKENFQYNNLSKVQSYIYYSTYDTVLHEWNKAWKFDFQYDNFGNMITFIYSDDYINNQWLISSKSEYIYNSSNQLISESYYERDTITNIFKPEYKIEITYNETQKLLIASIYDKLNSIWKPQNKCILQFNSNNYITETSQYKWKQNQWFVAETKSEYIRNSNDSITQFITYKADTISNIWLNLNKNENSYNNNLKTQSIEYQWNATNSIWQPIKKYEFTYNNSKLLILLMSYNWNSSNTIWEPNSKSEFTYNNLNLITEKYYYWASSQWNINTTKTFAYDYLNNLISLFEDFSEHTDRFTTYTYNLTYKNADIAFPSLYVWNTINWALSNPWSNYYKPFYQDFNYMLTKIDEYDGSMNYLGSVYYNFSNIDINNSIYSSPKAEFKLYPNPTTDYININGVSNKYKANIYSLSGKLILSIDCYSTDYKINVSDLESGIYIMQLQTDNVFASKIFVKQ